MPTIARDTINEIQRRDARNKEAEIAYEKKLKKHIEKLQELEQPFDEYEGAAQKGQRDAFRNFLTSLLESYAHFEKLDEVMRKRVENMARKKDAFDEWHKQLDFRLPKNYYPSGKIHDGKWDPEIIPNYREHVLRWYRLIESGGFPAVEDMDDGELHRWWRRKL